MSCLKLKEIWPVLFYNRVRNPNRLSTDDPIGTLSLIYMRCLVIQGFKQMIYDKVDCLVYQQIRSLDQYSVDCTDLKKFHLAQYMTTFSKSVMHPFQACLKNESACPIDSGPARFEEH